jgi:hypothetical protein
MEHDNLEHDSLLELDDAWLTEFYKLESEYNDFYKEIPRSAEVCFIYLDHHSKISKTSKGNISLNKQGTILKDELVSLISANKTIDRGSKMSLQSIVMYNFILGPDNILDIFGNKIEPLQYLREINTLQDITFKETCHFFNDVNTLYIFYKEQNQKSKSQNTTKKIFIKKKQTKRKTRYKRT